MNIYTIVVGPFEVNCFIVAPDKKHAIIIDPGAEPDKIISMMEKNDLTPVMYLCTHGHMDHISALAELTAAYPAPAAMHDEDSSWAFTERNQMLPYYPVPQNPGSIEIPLKGVESIQELPVSTRIIHTPGHSPGSVCFFFPDANLLFSGDTLFAGSVGRTDFHGGDTRIMMQSIKTLKELPDPVEVFPGHGPSTTIGHEKRTNYFMQGAR